MGQVNTVPRRINGAEGAAGQVILSGGPGAIETWGDPAGDVPSGVSVEFDGLIANIPAGYVICDGNNGTVNKLGRFSKQVDTALTEAGTTGGSTAKTTAGHNHNMEIRGISGAQTRETGDHMHADTRTDSIADIRPLYIDVLKIMKT